MIVKQINHIKRQLRKLIKRDIKNGIKEVKSKSFSFYIISILVCYILSCVTLSLIHKWDSGRYYGDKLEKYLINKIAEKFEFKNDRVEISSIDKHFINDLDQDEVIVVYGTYKYDKLFEGDDVSKEVFSRYITIFEKEEISLINFLISTEPKYKITAAYEIEDLGELFMYFEGHNFFDFNGDGTEELYIDLKSNFADCIAKSTLFFVKSEKSWDLLTPDFSSLKEDVSRIDKNYCISIIDGFSIKNILNTVDERAIYAIPIPGSLDFFKSNLFNHYDFCYSIPCWNKSEKILAYIMLKINGANLEIDNSWNGGNILFDESNEGIDVYDYMGSLKSGNMVFYSLP